MDLYGSVQTTKYEFNKWYMELPEFWSRDKEYVRTHPYLNILTSEWGEIKPTNFEFFKLEMIIFDDTKIFDLREDNWKNKLLMFISLYGVGWVSKGSIYDEKSPLDSILFLGNNNVLTRYGYLWSVMNHFPVSDKEGTEIWFYINSHETPEKYYTITRLNREEFLNDGTY